MRLTLLVLLTSLIATPSLAAGPYKTPQALLQALYSGEDLDEDPNAATTYTNFFSDALNQRFENDWNNTPDGEVGAIDFDPVIAGQDGEATDVEVGQPVIIDRTAEVEVTFTNFEPVTLYYTLVYEHGGWKVDDIANQQGEYPWSLVALFEAAR
ncbi:hypothetical protein QO002_002766 [Pararhizobium capsulatum DSM 1112]|uniref:DUF3828 domain-containing protein n=1 Tax=Pararhizobium capsulatum DSM 1112 TaxID=1121113 RepID=A0ABU0BQU9_9HYPH|nr:DUF3828 domain-containing protein [Pararhizobium capsulatum]MDQ0320628.1 hypothetical protein [Pararhizobium capsulatum DSM 1112]